MRIIGGDFKGTVLYGPGKGSRIRPTSDKVREALFGIIGSRIKDASFLDLFGGTGAVGFEAVSRGASDVTIVEADSIDLIRKNGVKLKIEKSEQLHLVRSDAAEAMKMIEKRGEMFDFIFADPPWHEGYEAETIKNVAGILASDGTLILEAYYKTKPPETSKMSKTSEMPEPDSGQKPGLRLKDSRRYGDTALHFYVF
ncbi:16S rRNA (guanine(966)-N(2))-methyltransferase [hydrothermal vent metagenome]|uniref:16S rRNA (Guanine(966)-N(2))-methyltransferase n=1 Tax=hydrothermal vent metagenome TaxID=652676 RepID=A0A3B1CJP0_9ZZZZ